MKDISTKKRRKRALSEKVKGNTEIDEENLCNSGETHEVVLSALSICMRGMIRDFEQKMREMCLIT
jgi:hypothetical protein